MESTDIGMTHGVSRSALDLFLGSSNVCIVDLFGSECQLRVLIHRSVHSP